MKRMFFAELAILLQFQPGLDDFFIFLGIMTNSFTLTAFEFNQIILGHNVI